MQRPDRIVPNHQKPVAEHRSEIRFPPKPKFNSLLEALYRRHGVEIDPRPEQYSIQWRNAEAVTAADHMAAKKFGAQMRMAPGQFAGIIDRVESLQGEVAALSDRDRAERREKVAQFVGEARYSEMLAGARAALKAGGEFKLTAAIEAVAAADPWLLKTLASWHENVSALNDKIAARGNGK